jgi:hypothetical protein
MSIFSLTLPSINDQSVYILNQIIGSVNHMIDPSQPSPGDYIIPGDPSSGIMPVPLFALMLQYFNQALLGAGTILFAIMVFVGTINTASDGQILGKNWHSMWTPLRLIFGLLFVVPLKSGLCIGQKIVLYAILIGVNIGTSVWQQTVDQIFQNSAPPPIPSFLAGTVTDAVDGVFLNLSVQSIASQLNSSVGSTLGSAATCSPTNSNGQPLPSNAVTVCVNNHYNLGSSQAIPNSVLTALTNQVTGLCNYLYPGLAGDCQSAAKSVITYAPFSSKATVGSTNYYFNIGNNPSQYTPSISGGSYDIPNISLPPTWPANGQINVDGFYAYIPNNMPAPSCTNIQPGDVSAYMYCEVNSIVQNYVTNNTGTSCPTAALKSGQTSCSFQGITSDILAQAQSQILMQQFDQAGDAPSITPGSGAYGSANTYIAPGSSCMTNAQGQQIIDTIPGGAREGQCVQPVIVNTNDYLIQGVNNDSQPIDIQLNNSWWQAGRSYLIIDNQFSQSLQYLYNELNSVISTFNQSNNFISNFNLNYSISMWEVGPSAAAVSCGPFNYDGMLPSVGNNNTSPLTALGYQIDPNSGGPFPSSVALYSCSTDAARGTALLDSSYSFQANDIAPSNWSIMIAPYNPNNSNIQPPPSSPGQAPPPQVPAADLAQYPDLYANLMMVPQQDQGPITLLLQMAYNYYNTNYPSPSAYNYYVAIMPGLTGIIHVLQFNGELSSSNGAANLPVTDAIDKIFSGLLGSDATDPESSLNSVMQQVYNLGSDPPTPGLVSKQFSLIQQTQSAGISMIMVCITSIEQIYQHYQNQFQAFENQLQTYVAWGTAAGAAGGVLTALGSFGGVFGIGASVAGQAASAGADVANLMMMQYTITQMTNISMSLIWLPMVLFVMTSLFTAGVQFALLVPLTPYILFWAGQIAWLLGVLEALVAAPIVMLGLAHPGGHEFMGHSVPAVRMLLSVVFRPVLMVIGMVTGIMLTYIVINFSAQGFHTVATSILNSVPQDDQMVQGILACLMLFVYCSFIVLAFNKCFSTIYVIPDKVMEWVGGGRGEQAGVQDLQGISSGVQQSAGQMADTGGKGLNQGIEAQQSKAQKSSDLGQQETSAVRSDAQGMGKSMADGVAQRRNDQGGSNRTYGDEQ